MTAPLQLWDKSFFREALEIVVYGETTKQRQTTDMIRVACGAVTQNPKPKG